MFKESESKLLKCTVQHVIDYAESVHSYQALSTFQKLLCIKPHVSLNEYMKDIYDVKDNTFVSYYADISGLDLSYENIQTDLNDLNFFLVYALGTNFHNQNLQNTNFAYANIIHANFVDADLKNANMSDVIAVFCDLGDDINDIKYNDESTFVANSHDLGGSLTREARIEHLVCKVSDITYKTWDTIRPANFFGSVQHAVDGAEKAVNYAVNYTGKAAGGAVEGWVLGKVIVAPVVCSILKYFYVPEMVVTRVDEAITYYSAFEGLKYGTDSQYSLVSNIQKGGASYIHKLKSFFGLLGHNDADLCQEVESIVGLPVEIQEKIILTLKEYHSMKALRFVPIAEDHEDEDAMSVSWDIEEIDPIFMNQNDEELEGNVLIERNEVPAINANPEDEDPVFEAEDGPEALAGEGPVILEEESQEQVFPEDEEYELVEDENGALPSVIHFDYNLDENYIAGVLADLHSDQVDL